MGWIESHQSLGRHPKLLRLSLELQIHKAQAVGHLKYLWWWALDYAPNGDLSGFSAQEISTAAEWPGDPTKFFETLKNIKWLDNDNKLHDWQEYSGAYFSSRKRQKKYRNKLRNSYVTVTATGHNITGHNITEHNNTPLPPDLQADKEAIENWLAYKQEKGKTYKGTHGLNALWSRLRKIPQAQRKEAIENSMAMNYDGIFPPKGGFNGTPKNNTTPSTYKWVPTKKPII